MGRRSSPYLFHLSLFRTSAGGPLIHAICILLITKYSSHGYKFRFEHHIALVDEWKSFDSFLSPFRCTALLKSRIY